MDSPERLRVAVVGAGAGGLVAAAYLAKAGLSVDVFEAQAHVGGCASCFSIGAHRFHAGATTLVGLEPHMPLARVLRELSVDVPHHVLDRAMAIAHEGTTLRLANVNAENVVLLRARFGDAFAAFWGHAARVAPRAWALIGDAPVPPRGLGDLAALASSRAAWSLLPELLSSAEGRLLGFGPASARARHVLDELLLVSTQSTAARTPALFGAVGCEYLERRLYMPHGGLGALFERLADRVRGLGGRVHLRARVDAVMTGSDGAGIGPGDLARDGRFALTMNGARERFDAVVLGVTCWDAARLVLGPVAAHFQSLARRHDRAWSAAGGYFVYDDVFPEDAPVYTQVVLDAPMRTTGARGLFVTLPPRGDAALNATAGKRTVTVSCHTEPEPWFALDDAAFKERRAAMLEEIQRAVRAAIPALEGAICHAAHAATPRTWEGFTGRHLGRVGGLPFGLDLRTLAYPTGRTPDPRLLAVGDTVFPGQSVTATAIGARRGALGLLEAIARGR
jgi:phytoene dehydrogenase-like protein